MKKDTLYLLKPDFHDGGKIYFCPGCAEVLGFLEFYPTVKDRLRIHYVDFQRPRAELVSLLGEQNQSCPVLVLGEPVSKLPPRIQVRQANGNPFVEGDREITEYLAHVHGTGIPH